MTISTNTEALNATALATRPKKEKTSAPAETAEGGNA